MKKCTKCGIEKELDDFCYNKSRKRYVARCKSCCRIISKKFYKNNKEKTNQQHKQYYEDNKKEIAQRHKKYNKDNKEKKKQQNKQYNKDNKEKIKQQNKQYYENNKEKISGQGKQHYKDNKEKIAEHHKQYNKDNKEKIKQQNKQYYENNKEKIKQHGKRWQKANPEKRRASSRKRRAWKLDLNENFTPEQEAFVLDQFNHKCFNCGSTENLRIDHHRALSKGNSLTLQNAVALCNSCNCSKNSKDPEEFYGSKICEKLDKRLVIIDIMYCVLISKQKEAEAQSNAKE